MTAEHGQDSATTLSLIGDFESTKHTGSRRQRCDRTVICEGREGCERWQLFRGAEDMKQLLKQHKKPYGNQCHYISTLAERVLFHEYLTLSQVLNFSGLTTAMGIWRVQEFLILKPGKSWRAKLPYMPNFLTLELCAPRVTCWLHLLII